MAMQMSLGELIVLDTATSKPTVRRTPAEMREKNEAFHRTMAIREMGLRMNLAAALKYLPLSLEDVTALWHQAQADKAADLARYGESVRFRYEKYGVTA